MLVIADEWENSQCGCSFLRYMGGERRRFREFSSKLHKKKGDSAIFCRNRSKKVEISQTGKNKSRMPENRSFRDRGFIGNFTGRGGGISLSGDRLDR